MERKICELKRGDLFAYENDYVLYFGGLTHTEQKGKLVLHATDLSGETLRFSVNECEVKQTVQVRKEASETVSERCELSKFASMFSCKLPHLAWLF